MAREPQAPVSGNNQGHSVLPRRGLIYDKGHRIPPKRIPNAVRAPISSSKSSVIGIIGIRFFETPVDRAPGGREETPGRGGNRRARKERTQAPMLHDVQADLAPALTNYVLSVTLSSSTAGVRDPGHVLYR